MDGDQEMTELPKENNGAKYRVIIWFRNDLRVHDNYSIRYALDNYAKQYPGNVEFVAIYVYDPRKFSEIDPNMGTRKCGIHRTKFINEAVTAFRKTLQAIGSGLAIVCDKAEDVIP